MTTSRSRWGHGRGRLARAALRCPYLAHLSCVVHKHLMPDTALERETLEFAAADAAKVLGVGHGVTKALAKAAITMDTVDLWWARLAVKTLRKDQRAAIAEAAED